MADVAVSDNFCTGAVPVANARTLQVNFHTTLSGEALVSLLYHRKLDEVWREAAQKLRQALAAGCPSLKGYVPGLLGRSRGVKAVLGDEFVTDRLSVDDGRTLTYRQAPCSIWCLHRYVDLATARWQLH